MAEPKTKKNDNSIDDFLASVDDQQRAEDCRTVMKMMEKIVGEPGSLWGPSIIGFGTHKYQYASGKEAEWMLTGLSPRKQNLTLYIMSGFSHYDELLSKLGKHKTGKSCLYVKRLDEIDMNVLEELIRKSVEFLKEYKR